MNDSCWSRRIHEPFILAALGIALTAGFGYAAILVAALALQMPLGTWWVALAQAHGHAQLFGWLGLFILGMGLFFLPRLRGARLRATQFAPHGFWLFLSGIILHSLAQPALAFVAASSASAMLWRALWVLAALLEFAGLLLLVRMLIATERAEGRLSRDSPAYPVAPFAMLALLSFMLALSSNLLGTFSAALDGRGLVPGVWDTLIIQFMLYGVAMPMAFVFSVRNLPLFLRLAKPPRDELRALALAYALSLLARLSPNLAALGGFDIALLNALGALGTIVQSTIILVFVWMLDLLRRRPPWTVERPPNTRPDLDYLRKPTRRNYPDYGEYGRFELLIYSAYLWLVVAASMGVANGASALLSASAPLPSDAERHTLTLGFITLLIFGMAARMVPGFSGKRGVGVPALVAVTFVLGNLALVARVAPLFFPGSNLALALLGSSGALGWLAVACVAFNLWRTLRA